MADRYIVQKQQCAGVASMRDKVQYEAIDSECWRVLDTRNDAFVGPEWESPEQAQAEADSLNHRLG